MDALARKIFSFCFQGLEKVSRIARTGEMRIECEVERFFSLRDTTFQWSTLVSDKPTLIYLFINPGGGGITLFSFSLGEGDLSPRLGEEVVHPLVNVQQPLPWDCSGAGNRQLKKQAKTFSVLIFCFVLFFSPFLALGIQAQDSVISSA